MSKKELRNGEIISRVVNGDLTQEKASWELKMSLRQVKRLCKRFRNEGVQGLAHRSRGRTSSRKINSSTRAGVLELIKNDYSDFGPQLIKEQLERRNQLRFSREWIRCLMIEDGIWKVKKRGNLRYYQRRNQRACEGELLQIDGSPEHWFEDRGPKCCLINMVDDATSKIMECRFVKEECLEGYFQSMKRYIERYGLPQAVYSDRHTIFKSPKSETQPALTQFGRAMKELGIELIFANSPQAKGRVERSHGTLQDRLIKLMRLDKISTIEEGNKYLEEFKKDYNSRFGKPARSFKNAHRTICKEKNAEKMLCRKEERKISKALEVKYKHSTYQLVPKNNFKRLAGKTALVCESGEEVRIEVQGEEYEYKIYQEQPYQEKVLDRKRIDSFLDRKKPMSAIEKHRKRKLAI